MSSDTKKQPDPIYICWSCFKWWETAEGENCPFCKQPGKLSNVRFKNLLRGQGRQTGPKTEAGKKKCRLNAVKHGHKMTVSPIYPAKFDKYPECFSCEHREKCENDNEFRFCPVKTEKVYDFMTKFIAAKANGDLESLDELIGATTAKTYAILQSMISDVLTIGTTVEETTTNKEGDLIYSKYKQHPVLETIPKFMTAIGFTADQQMMTPKAKGEEQKTDMLEEMMGKMMGGIRLSPEQAVEEPKEETLEVEFE